ncbi:MAG: hypothetical protein IT204_13825 [Fimbriimonadaceae bacterium]|nr:hypothetical protein [Fimbriimonadaceae bacterium]
MQRRWAARQQALAKASSRLLALLAARELAEPHRFHKHNLQCFGNCPYCHDRAWRRLLLRPADARRWLPAETADLADLPSRLLARTKPGQPVQQVTA